MRRVVATVRLPLALAAVFCVLVVGTLLGARHFYQRQRDAIRESRVLQVQGTTNLQADRINGWLDQARQDASLVALATARFLRDAPAQERVRLVQSARIWAEALQVNRGYVSVHLLDAQGNVLLHQPSQPHADPVELRWLAQEAIAAGLPVSHGLQDGPRGPSFRVAAPIWRAEAPSKVVGAVVLVTDPQQSLFRLLAGQSQTSHTWETLLVQTPDLRCVVLRTSGPQPVRRTVKPIPANDTILSQAVMGRTGHLYGEDDRGRVCLAQIVPLEQPGWLLVGRESMEETDRLLRAFIIPWITAVIALIMVCFAVLLAVWQRQTRRYYQQLLEEEVRRSAMANKLAESEILLRTVLDTVPQRVFWKDRKSRYLGCNLPFAKDAGRERPEELLGEDDYAMAWHANAELYREDDRQVMESGQAKLAYEEPQDIPNGRRRWLRTSKVPLKNDRGEIVGVLGTYEDITKEKLNLEQLEEAKRDLEEKNRELTELLHFVSHDLRSPLVTVSSFAEEVEADVEALRGLLEGLSVPAERANRIRALTDSNLPRSTTFILDAAKTMGRLLDGVLTISRYGRATYRSEPVDMAMLVRRVVDAMDQEIRSAGAAVEVGELPPCLGDAERLEHVVRNLLSNALKYRDPNRRCQVRVSGSPQGRYVIYCMEDNGIGIPSDKVEKVFEMFVRAAPDDIPGEGLGLASVRVIVGRHGGRCWIESQEGKSTRVCFTVPAVSEADEVALREPR